MFPKVTKDLDILNRLSEVSEDKRTVEYFFSLLGGGGGCYCIGMLMASYVLSLYNSFLYQSKHKNAGISATHFFSTSVAERKGKIYSLGFSIESVKTSQ